MDTNVSTGYNVASTMDNSEMPMSLDQLFQQAVSAIDAGDVSELETLLAAHPRLLREPLSPPGDWLRESVGSALEGYFKQPYLLWFVAENPIRNEKLPQNITLVARAIIETAKRLGIDNLQHQLDYTLTLVCTGRVARECGVQIELMDVLIDSGASPDGATLGSLAHRELAATKHLLNRGAKLTLAVAVCLGRDEDVTRLAPTASLKEQQVALAAAALNGKAEALAMLTNTPHRLLAGELPNEVVLDLNAFAPDGFHSHATALHHAVDSGSLDSVKVLVEAGAELGTKDILYQGTPLDWAEYLGRTEIAAYLREQVGPITRN